MFNARSATCLLLSLTLSLHAYAEETEWKIIQPADEAVFQSCVPLTFLNGSVTKPFGKIGRILVVYPDAIIGMDSEGNPTITREEREFFTSAASNQWPFDILPLEPPDHLSEGQYDVELSDAEEEDEEEALKDAITFEIEYIECGGGDPPGGEIID